MAGVGPVQLFQRNVSTRFPEKQSVPGSGNGEVQWQIVHTIHQQLSQPLRPKTQQ